MKKSPIEIVRFNPVHKEKVDSKSAKLLRSKLYQLSKESIINESPYNHKKGSTKNVHSGLNRKSIAVPPLPDVGSDGLLPLQVCNWLIYSHLLRWNYRCTIASFQSESQMSGSPDNTFTVYDILDLLGISRDSIFYTNFLAEYHEMENRGMLYTLLKHCIKHHIVKSSTDVAIQVNSLEKVKSIAEKLKEIDEVFKEKQQKLRETSSESLDNKAKSMIENKEMSQIERAIEIENIKQREKMIYENKLEDARSRIKEEYELRLQILQEKQIEYQTEIQKKRLLEQQEINRLKEQFVQELDNLQKYEEATKQEMEQKKNHLDVEEKMLNERKSELQMKVYELEKQRIQAAAMNDEMSDNLHKSSALKVDQKLAKLKEWEEKLQREAEWLQEERNQASKKANAIDDLRPKLYELELSLKSLQEKYTAVVKQNTRLSSKLESLADYSSVKAELSSTKKELETVKEHLAETRKEALYVTKSNIEQLREQRSPERREQYHLSSVDSSHQVLLQEQCKRLEKEIEELHHLNRNVITRNDQQQKEIEDLKRTVHSFEMRMYYSQSKVSDIPVKENRNIVSPIVHLKDETPLVSWENRKNDSIYSFSPSTTRKHTVPSLSSSVPYSLKRARSFDKEKPLRFITEARRRIDYLQIEAEALEKKYGEYLQSQANLFWSIPTSINTMFSSAQYSSLSQTLHDTNKTYHPYSATHSFKNKFSTHSHLHPLSTLETSNYPTIISTSKPLRSTRLHLAESTHISIQPGSPQSKSERSSVEKNKHSSSMQLPHKIDSLQNKEMEEQQGSQENTQVDESFKNDAKTGSEAKESLHSVSSKEFSKDESKKDHLDLEPSSRSSKSLKLIGKDHSMKSENGISFKSSKADSKEENIHLNEVLLPVPSPIKTLSNSKIQEELPSLEKEEKPLDNMGLFRDNLFEKHSSEKEHVGEDINPVEEHSLKSDQVEKNGNVSEKHSLNRSDIEVNISSSELHNKNVHTLPSALNNGEKARVAPEDKSLLEHGIGDATDINKQIDHSISNNKVALPENNHSISGRKSENENSSSHNTDAPEISEISISGGSIGHISKGSAESDFW